MKDDFQTLRGEIERLKSLLGLRDAPAVGRPEDRSDYIAHGSPEHAVFLGLVTVEDVEAAREMGFIVYTSPETDAIYRLDDQITPFMHYPDPMQVAKLVLMQKVNSLESGKPEPPVNAPSMWVPIDQYTTPMMV